jgi:hypothetical protein
MNKDSHQLTNHHITTDDLAFSAYLKMKGFRLIKCDQKESKTLFTFDLDGRGDKLKVKFINSPFLQFYNELRNLKKML